jgi:hypothetical protein
MVTTMRSRQDEHPDDLLVVDSPPLRGRLSESGFADSPLLAARPSFGERAARGFIRFLIAGGIGVAGTLAWQSYGDAARQTIATWGAAYGWPMAWLSAGDAVNANPSRADRTQAVPATQAAPATAPDRRSSSDLEQLKTMTLGLAATLNTMRERIEQVAAGQEQTASEVAKLQAAEQEIRHKMSAIAARPAVAAPSKPPAPTPAPARPPAPAPPR